MVFPVDFPQEKCTLTLPFPYFTKKPTSSLDGLKISESKYIKWNKCLSSSGKQSENKEPLLPRMEHLPLMKRGDPSRQKNRQCSITFHLLLQIFHTIFFWHSHENLPPLSALSPLPTISLLSSANHRGEVQLLKTRCSKRNVPFDLFLFFAGFSNIKFPLLQSQESFFVFPISETHPVLMAKEKKKAKLSWWKT